MNEEDFTNFLEINEIAYSENERSVILFESPCCNTRNKIYLYKDNQNNKPLFGKCMKCETPWSSWTYLHEMGFEKKAIDNLHGGANIEDLQLNSLPIMGWDVSDKKKATKYEPEIFSVDEFYKVSELPEHPASVYAKKRGWTDAQNDSILIDTMSNSVVFVCREGEYVVGYQRRFLKPVTQLSKTKTVPGFRKTQHVIEYEKNNDIVICEGPFTALSAWHYGFHGICTFGASVSERQLDIIADIAKRSGKKVGVAFDLDKAGRKGYLNICRGMYWRGVKTFRVLPEFGNDLNDSWMARKGVQIIDTKSEDITIPDLEFEV